MMQRLYAEVRQTIFENKEKIKKLAEIVLEKETLSGDEVKQIFEGTYTDNDRKTSQEDTRLPDFILGGLPNSIENSTLPSENAGIPPERLLPVPIS